MLSSERSFRDNLITLPKTRTTQVQAPHRRRTADPFVVRRSVISAFECEAILCGACFPIRYYRSNSTLFDCRVEIAYVKNNSAPELFRFIEKLAIGANIWNLSVTKITEDIRIQRYKKGDYSKTHTDYDTSAMDYSKLTVVIPLVDRSDWEGGDLQIGNGLYMPRLTVGDAVVFPRETRI